ncbi:HET-domain-containing protein, partial [Hyaloscypha variabilis F]
LKALWSLASGKWRCGVCLFELGFGIMPLEIDVIGSYGPESVFWSSDYHEFSHENLVKSARRGCRSCKRMVEAFDTFPAEFEKAQWWPARSGERPRLVLAESQRVFELFVDPENYSEAIPLIQPCICAGRRLPGCTRDEASLDQAARWLAACRSEHEQCRAQDVSFQPTRLLYLGDEDQESIQLVGKEAPCSAYAALSHRWSEETQQVRLEQNNLAQRKENGISLCDFPPMMQDAISVLRRLGILYVWIDCMCIVQDDKDDWAREAATMASIYANAELTLAATWCNGSGQSLFQDSGSSSTAVDIRDVDGTPIFLRPVWPHYTARDTEDELLAEIEWPLLTRAWVYQEQFLSRRMLHFMRKELFWECNKELDCQCSWYRPSNSSTSKPLVSIFKQPAVFKQWGRILSEYTSCNLTFKSDSLPALAGIAKSFSRQRPEAGKYLCGLWERELESCFFWYLAEPAISRPEISRMPSWSWASVTGKVTCWGVSLEGIEFLGAEVIYHGDAYMGNVEKAKVSLCGWVAQGTVYHGQQWANMLATISATCAMDEDREVDRESGDPGFGLKVGDQFATFQPDYLFDDSMYGLTHIASGSRVVCLTFGRLTSIRSDPELEREERSVSVYCLVLRCVDEGEELYERIG